MYQVLVFLTAGDGGIDSLRSFERKALRIIESHGGRLVTAFAPEAHDNAEKPDEVHLLEFPAKRDFLAYRNDPKVTEMASERAAAISNTLVYTSAHIVDSGVHQP